MANKRITELPAGDRMRADDVIEVVQFATSKQISLEEIAPGPDMPPAVANAMDDEFDAGALASKWTWINQGTATISFSKSCAIIKALPFATDTAKIIVQAVPARPYTVTAKIFCDQQVRTPFMIGGLCFTESATVASKITSFGIQCITGPIEKICLKHWTLPTSAPGSDVGPSTNIGQRKYMYYRMTDNNTNLIFEYSHDGVLFYTLTTIARTAHMAAGPAGVGIICSGSQNTIDSYIVADWFRRTA